MDTKRQTRFNPFLTSFVFASLVFSCVEADTKSKVEPPKASVVAKLAGTFLGAAAGGGTSFFAYKKFGDEFDVSEYMDDNKKMALWIGSNVVLGGLSGYVVTSFFGKIGKGYYDSYQEALKGWLVIQQNPIYNTPVESLHAFIEKHYAGEDNPYEKALSVVNKLIKALNNQQERVEGIVDEISDKGGTWYRLLTKEARKLFTGMKGGLVNLHLRKDIIVNGKEYDQVERDCSGLQEQMKKVENSALLLCEEDQIEAVVAKEYENYEVALQIVDSLLGLSKSVSDSAKKIAEGISKKESEEYKILLQKCEDLTKRADLARSVLEKRKEIISELKAFYEWEAEYKKMDNIFMESYNLAQNYIVGTLTERVNDSYEKTVAYGMSVVDKNRPLVGIVRVLRNRIKEVEAFIKACAGQHGICLSLSDKDERYAELANEYAELISSLRTQFPFELFEQRIHEICSSKEYEKELEIVDKEMRHKEIVDVLNTIQLDLSDAVGKVRGEVSKVENNLSGINNGIASNNTKISSVEAGTARVINGVVQLENNLVDVSRAIRGLGDGLAGVNNNVTCANDRIYQLEVNLGAVYQSIEVLNRSINALSNNIPSNDFSSQLDRIEGALMSLANVISSIEHNVANIERKID